MQHVDLSKNNISEIKNLHYCLMLQTLNLSYNNISILRDIESHLGNVNKLYLSNNQLKTLQGFDVYIGFSIDCSD